MANMIGILLWMAAAACYAELSILSFYHYSVSYKKPSFWGENSWRMKYRYPFIWTKKNLYYRIFNIEYKERFPLSATLLVWLTDGFHLMQFIMLWCISTSLVITHYNLVDRPWWWTLCYVLGYRILWSATFTLFFNFILKK